MVANHALEDYEVDTGFVLTRQSYPVHSGKVVWDYDQSGHWHELQLGRAFVGARSKLSILSELPFTHLNSRTVIKDIRRRPAPG